MTERISYMNQKAAEKECPEDKRVYEGFDGGWYIEEPNFFKDTFRDPFSFAIFLIYMAGFMVVVCFLISKLLMILKQMG